MNCLNSFKTENKLRSHEIVCKNKDFCGIPSEKDKILEFNQYMKPDKIPYIIYADIESLIRKVDWWANNPQKSSTTKISEHIPCGYSMLKIGGFDYIKNIRTLYRGNDFMKNICPSLRGHGKNITDFEKKKILPLKKEELKSYEETKACYICWKKSLKKFSKEKNYPKVRDHCHYTGKYKNAICKGICIDDLKFDMVNEIPVVFHDDSNYDYYFIIKELANAFERWFECLGENKEKYKTFSVPIKNKITKIDEDGNESVRTVSYKIEFIDSAVQDLRQVHYQILLIISWKEFVKLNVKFVIIFLNVKVSTTI